MVIVPIVYVLTNDFSIRCQPGTSGRRNCGIYRIGLLVWLLFYIESPSTCWCRGALLLDENFVFRKTSSSSTAALPSRSDDTFTGGDIAGQLTRHEIAASQTNILNMAAATIASGDIGDSLYIVRNNGGDTFIDSDENWLSCSLEKCSRRSGGTATVSIDLNNILDIRRAFFERGASNGGGIASMTTNDKLCYCRCLSNTPIFREDLHLCVDDIHECPLATFVSSGNIQQKIPYVFLPLRGQIIHPNAEIKFNGVNSAPTCILSRVRYLSRAGWIDIRNYSISEYTRENSSPFKLFHDKHRTFLQWLGNNELRLGMEGRLLLIELICKDMDSQLIFTPCISFRVAGIPSTNKLFADDEHDPSSSNFEQEKKFSSNEYVALTFATVLIALIYVASVFLYLRFKKNKLEEKSLRRNNAFKSYSSGGDVIDDNVSHLFGESVVGGQSKPLVVEEEGLVKNNPLLMKRYHTPANLDIQPIRSLNENNCTFVPTHVDTNVASDIDKVDVYNPSTTATTIKTNQLVDSRAKMMIGKGFEASEPRWSIFRSRLTTPFELHNNEQTVLRSNYVKQPSMDTNMVEKHPDENISIVECPEDVVQPNSKHKLYFNPAYLEPELLMAPPPAALEFLHKIREIMTMAKRKISTKKFTPSLVGIPEETQNTLESVVKRHPSIRQQICESITTNNPPPPHVINAAVALRTDDKEKRQIIQQWLQTIPTTPQATKVAAAIPAEIQVLATQQPPVEKSPAAQITPKKAVPVRVPSFEKLRPIKPPTVPTKVDTAYSTATHRANNHRVESSRNNVKSPYDVPRGTNVVQNTSSSNIHMDQTSINDEHRAISNRTSEQQNNTTTTVATEPLCDTSVRLVSSNQNDRAKNSSRTDETSSRDDTARHDVSNLDIMSNPTTVNSGLPLDEELTMQNAIYNVVTGSTTMSKLKPKCELNYRHREHSHVDDCHLTEEHVNGQYSLVSEVYINDDFSSTGSSLSSSLNSLVELPSPRQCSMTNSSTAPVTTTVDTCHESSRLMIQLENCPFFYAVDQNDDFEPDTLDRKPSAHKENENAIYQRSKFVDSLERPAICLRTSGSLRNDTSGWLSRSSTLKRSSSSLQEWCQQRPKTETDSPAERTLRRNGYSNLNNVDAPLSLQPQIESQLWRKNRQSPASSASQQQPRHYCRQRKQSPPPPLPPPAAVGEQENTTKTAKPPIPSRKQRCQHALKMQNLRLASFADTACFNNNVWSYRPDDSGYLSSSDSDDRNESATTASKFYAADKKNAMLSKGDQIQRAVIEATVNYHKNMNNKINVNNVNKEEDDEDDDDDDDNSESSFNDANSESGAESTATNFKFYKNRGRICNES